MEKNYSDLSKSLTNELSSSVKKEQGIFFTPKESIVTFSNFLKNVLKHQFKTVLEPSCGSCEFIKYFDATNEDIQITGIEYNTKIYESIQGLSFQNNVQILHKDFLTYETDKNFDLILGNPPYFVMKKSDLPDKFHHCIIGRPNIFLAFILKSLELLNENGILAFVLPKSFLNCSYYKKLREEIYNHYSVKKIIDCSDHQYLETQQETILLILKKTSKKINNERYVLNNDFYLFNTKENIMRMKELIQGSTTLHQLGFQVFNGNFVWNQEREYLTNDLNDRRLIYSNDIIDNKLRELNSNEINEKWSIGDVAVAHRLGSLEIGDISLVVAVSAPHRGDAFLACQYSVDRIKQIVPIWKKEMFEDGEIWVGSDGEHYLSQTVNESSAT